MREDSGSGMMSRKGMRRPAVMRPVSGAAPGVLNKQVKTVTKQVNLDSGTKSVN